jgi:hypothetical protein
MAREGFETMTPSVRAVEDGNILNMYLGYLYYRIRAGILKKTPWPSQRANYTDRATAACHRS